MSDQIQLSYWKHSWPLRPDVCPCDVDFCDFIDEHHVRDSVIFHFGTGEHHVVGRRNMALEAPNHIVAITASRPEYAAYIDYIVADPHAANYYKVIFADIYTLSARILPQCDLVTLFHLCEFFRAQHSAYAPLDDRRLLSLFISRLGPDGRALFYRGSLAADKMLLIVEEFVAAGILIHEQDYKTLRVYRVAKSVP